MLQVEKRLWGAGGMHPRKFWNLESLNAISCILVKEFTYRILKVIKRHIKYSNCGHSIYPLPWEVCEYSKISGGGLREPIQGHFREVMCKTLKFLRGRCENDLIHRYFRGSSISSHPYELGPHPMNSTHHCGTVAFCGTVALWHSVTFCGIVWHVAFYGTVAFCGTVSLWHSVVLWHSVARWHPVQWCFAGGTRGNAIPPLFSLGERRPPWQESNLGECRLSQVMPFLSFLNSPKPYNTVQWTSWKPTDVLLRDPWEASNHWSIRPEQRWW